MFHTYAFSLSLSLSEECLVTHPPLRIRVLKHHENSHALQARHLMRLMRLMHIVDSNRHRNRGPFVAENN